MGSTTLFNTHQEPLLMIPFLFFFLVCSLHSFRSSMTTSTLYLEIDHRCCVCSATLKPRVTLGRKALEYLLVLCYLVLDLLTKKSSEKNGRF